METLETIIKRRTKELKKARRKVNTVHFITDTFYQLKGWDTFPKEYYRKTKRLSYARHAKDAKLLYEYCNHDLNLALNILYQIASEAKQRNFDWVISTIFKRWEKKRQKS